MTARIASEISAGRKNKLFFFLIICSLLFFFAASGEAIAGNELKNSDTLDEPMPMMKKYPPPGEEYTYASRVLNRRDVHFDDPNIWVYTADFANRFKMPVEWISPDLKGAEAIAFRVVPDYRQCGWGGNKSACKQNVECVMDVYFDNKKQPLPWDDRMRWTDFDSLLTSAHFLSYVKASKRPAGAYGLQRTPFSVPATKKELIWVVSKEPRFIAAGIASVRVYDRGIFEGVSFTMLNTTCSEYKQIQLQTPMTDGLPVTVFHAITFPEAWRQRTLNVIHEMNEINQAHFKKTFEDLKKQPADQK